MQQLRSRATPSHLGLQTHGVSQVRAQTPPLVANIQKKSIAFAAQFNLSRCIAYENAGAGCVPGRTARLSV